MHLFTCQVSGTVLESRQLDRDSKTKTETVTIETETVKMLSRDEKVSRDFLSMDTVQDRDINTKDQSCPIEGKK